jgi:NADPH2:quinone reductase
MPKLMHAVIMRETGGPEVLRYEEVPVPALKPGEVLVKVGAVSVNQSMDVLVRSGKYNIKPTLPHVPGIDPAGTVFELGEGVDGPPVGTRVAIRSNVHCGTCASCRAGKGRCEQPSHVGLQRWGGYADYVAVPARNLYHIADNITFAEASVISRHFPTAFSQLEERAKLQPGEWILIMGAAGALGSCLVQVAKHMGGRVIAGAGSDERVQSCLANGAEFGVNYRSQDLAAEVQRITAGHGADVVAENIADPDLWPGAFDSLAYQGRLVTTGAHGGPIVPLNVRRLYNRHISIIGGAGGSEAGLVRALEAAAKGHVGAVIGKVMPLAEAAEAHRLVEAHAVIGKLMLQPE